MKGKQAKVRTCRFDSKNNRVIIFTSTGKIKIENPPGFSDKYLKIEVTPHKDQGYRFIYSNTGEEDQHENKNTTV